MPASHSKWSPAPAAALASMLVFAGSLLLAGCGLLDEDLEPFVARPASLQPEADVFSQSPDRSYLLTESLRRAGQPDSLLLATELELLGGDTVTVILPGDTSPAPVAVFTRLGLRPSKFVFDPASIPDPGSDLPFPETPVAGWRHDTTAGDLRFVRVLSGVETISQGGRRHGCWVFAESTYWAGTGGSLLGAGKTWMGATGLVRHQSSWAGFTPSITGSGGILIREILAQ